MLKVMNFRNLLNKLCRILIEKEIGKIKKSGDL